MAFALDMQGMRRRRQAQEISAASKAPQHALQCVGKMPTESGTRLAGKDDGDVLAMVA
jgi:hypothetical protein